MIKFNFKHALVVAVSLAGMSLGTVGVSANANDGNQTYTAAQTVSNQQTVTTMETTSTTGNRAVVAEALNLAKQHIPYVWGGESLKGMDCSGLTEWVYARTTGETLGHNTVIQEGHVTKQSVAQAQPGDLLFWGSAGATYHVGIYIGNGQYVAAPAPGQDVSVQAVSSSFMPSFSGHVN
ncbi:C40 family peptidase [Pediococcus siamensis]|uniref:C40 family peptidase n=1 Tax=Pediococcus siamensis TaxID=381829 RepID=UPI0039A0D92E